MTIGFSLLGEEPETGFVLSSCFYTQTIQGSVDLIDLGIKFVYTFE